MKQSAAGVFQWPSQEFRGFCERLFESLNSAACRILLSVEPRLASVLEQSALDPGEMSESFMHLFNYTGMGDPLATELACREHTDSGLVTVIPRSSAKEGLEVLDRSTGCWVQVETLFPEESTIACILIGETLAGILESPATVHRVSITQPRVSIPFQLRADRLAIDRNDPDALKRVRESLLLL